MSLAASTKSTYATAEKQYRSFVRTNGWLEQEPIRADRAMRWLTHLAAAGQHSANTIALYSSALRTAAEMETAVGTNRPNPMDDPLVARLLAGIAKDRASLEQQKRAARASTYPLTYDLVKQMQSVHDPGKTGDALGWAALTCAVAASLRPSELLGSSKLRSRALRANQITFFADDTAAQPLCADDATSATPSPSRYELKLLTSKVDPLRRGKVKNVGDPTAVGALWQWMRASRVTGEQLIFRLHSTSAPYSTARLLTHVKAKLARIGRSDIHLTGKSFRYGSASTLSALGVEGADIARTGWAPGSMMWQRVYANNPAAIQQRDLAINRRLATYSSRT